MKKKYKKQKTLMLDTILKCCKCGIDVNIGQCLPNPSIRVWCSKCTKDSGLTKLDSKGD